MSQSNKLALTEVITYLWDQDKYTSDLQAVTGIDYEIVTMPINYRQSPEPKMKETVH